MLKKLTIALVLASAILAIIFTASPSDASVKDSVVKLETLGRKSTDSDIDINLLKAIGIIDGMAQNEKWAQVKNLINMKKFTYSKYYDELLYIYMAHLANGKNRKEMDYLWDKMRDIKDSIHIFPAMLIRMFSQKDSAYYNAELKRTFEYIMITPPKTKIHGPMIEGNFLFGYSVQEDFSMNPVPKVYTLKSYMESPEPLDGFSENTQYVGLLEQYVDKSGFSPSVAETLAELYEKGDKTGKSSDMHYKLAKHYNSTGAYGTASKHIKKASAMSPTNQPIRELQKKIELTLVLQSGDNTDAPSPAPETKRSASCDNGYFFNHNNHISAKELRGKGKKQLRLMRNEIFARHGRPFRSQDLHDYFTNKCWYKVNIEYSDSVLTSADRNNVLTIRSVEDSK